MTLKHICAGAQSTHVHHVRRSAGLRGQGYLVIKYLYITVLNQYVAISGLTFTFCAVLNMFLRPVEFA